MPEKRRIAAPKRQKIRDSNKSMLLWIVLMSAVVGFGAVISYFLWQQIVFRQKVISEKNDTISVLRENNEVAEVLAQNIRALEANQALRSTKVDTDDKALQVIYDALPADANSLALGASLQEKLFAGIDGLRVQAFSVESSAQESAADSEEVEDEDTESGAIAFRLVVESDRLNSLDELLRRFERSIRVIDITTLTLEGTGDGYTLLLDAQAYYEPEILVNLETKVVQP
jgi:hypothetical protein